MRINPNGWRTTVVYLAGIFAAACVLLAVSADTGHVSLVICIALACQALALAFLLREAELLAGVLGLVCGLLGAVGVLAYLLAHNGISVPVSRFGFALAADMRLHLGAALALVLGGGATALAATHRWHGFAAEAIAAAGLVLVLLVPAVLFLQQAQPALHEAAQVQAMAARDAQLLLGGGVLLLLAASCSASFDIRNRLLPAFAFGLLLAASFQLWLVLVGEEQLAIARQAQATAARIQASIKEHLDERRDALQRLAMRLADLGPARRREYWAADAQSYLHDFQSISAIGWIEPDMRVRWALSRDDPHHFEGEVYAVDAVRLRALEVARQAGRTAFSDPVKLRAGGYGQVVALPMHEAQRFIGWLVVGLRFDQLFASEIGTVAPDFGVRILQGDIVLFERSEDSRPHPYSVPVVTELRTGNLAWRVEVWPATAYFSSLFLWLPGCLLTLGLLASLLFAFALFQLESQRRRTASLRASEERYRIVAEQTGALVYDYHVPSGRIDWAGAIREVTGEAAEAFAALDVHGWEKRLHPDDAPRVLDALERARAGLARFECEYRFAHAAGGYLRVLDRGVFLPGPDGKAERMLGKMADVSERHDYEQQLRYLAHFDQQTGLRNRTWFMEDAVHRAEAGAAAEQWLLFMDVDRFRAVNETLGHVVGDLLLEAVARRLEATVADRGELARVGGDEFALSSRDRSLDQDGVAGLCEELARAFAAPFEVVGHSLFVTLSIGVASVPRDGTDVQQVIRAAETAMFRAKQRGRNTWAFYESAMSVGARENMEIANALRRALECDEFHLVFQPRFDLAGGEITGMEALLRWDSATLGAVSPAQFIPVAEETGLIGPIGWYVVEAAAAAAHRLGPALMRNRRIAINVSARQLIRGDFVTELLRRVDAAGATPRWFELELTESLVMEDPARARRLFLELHAAGFAISIDDFGTGYSSLSYLKHFPVDHLKIDRSFVTGLPHDADDAAIVRTIVGMGQGLGLKLIAEGIETEAQRRFLQEAGCGEGQGFLFARPLALDSLAQRLAGE